MTSETSTSEQSGNRFSLRAQRLKSGYATLAVISLNFLVIYLLINAGLAIAFKIYDASLSNPVTEQYGKALAQVYPDFNDAERQEMLDENWNRSFGYSDFTHFREQPHTGKYVNVADAGFRHSKLQGPWPIQASNFNVFVFGGSTTYGYGVPDWQTVPSFLQEELSTLSDRPVKIYNFGVGWFYSTQERLLFERLLIQGHVPDIALFIDGLNDTWHAPTNRPSFSDAFAAVFDQVQGFGEQDPSKRRQYVKILREALVDRLPIGRLISGAARRLKSGDKTRGSTDGLTNKKTDQFTHASPDRDYLDRACDCYFTNKFLIEKAAQRSGVTPIFVWQPSPGYKYNMEYHAFSEVGAYESVRLFYERMRDRLSSLESAEKSNFIWCADIQQDLAECLYVDQHHYSAKFSQTFSKAIINGCLEKKLITPESISD